MNLIKLRSELDADPNARGYDGMGASAVTVDMNTEYVNRNREFMSASEIFEAITVAEYKALAAGEKGAVQQVLNLGDSISIGVGTKARDFLLDAFPAGSDSRTNLAAVASETISRATELGLGRIRVGHVLQARAL